MVGREFDGKTVLVTGAGKGLGAAIAAAFAKAGASVALCARTLPQVEGVARAIERAGGTAAAFRCDVRSEPEVEALLAGVVERFGGLDVVVNNAGVFVHAARWPRASEASWDEAFDTNVKGPWLVAKHAAPHMPDGAVIINVTSGLARGPSAGYAPYSVSKAALEALTRSLAAALPNLRVNCVNPGVVRTDMSNGLGLPADVVAPAFVWLAGGDAAGATGKVFHADEIRMKVLHSAHVPVTGGAAAAGSSSTPARSG
ncbi:MAG: SDR family NAD(P)-dependent oxidoreductase [Thermoplasmatota archaeon]